MHCAPVWKTWPVFRWSRRWTGWGGSPAPATRWIRRHSAGSSRSWKLIAGCSAGCSGCWRSPGGSLPAEGRSWAGGWRQAPATRRRSLAGIPRRSPTNSRSAIPKERSRSPCCAAAAPRFPTSSGGRADGVDLLFSGTPSAVDLYREAPGYRTVNRIVGDAVAAAVAGLPEGARLRVLEVGAGAGGTTAAVLPKLPAERVDYTYTDISPAFFEEAEGRFGSSGAVIECRTLDIEREPHEQGFRSARLAPGARCERPARDPGPRAIARKLPPPARALGDAGGARGNEGGTLARSHLRAFGWVVEVRRWLPNGSRPRRSPGLEAGR